MLYWYSVCKMRMPYEAGGDEKLRLSGEYGD